MTYFSLEINCNQILGQMVNGKYKTQKREVFTGKDKRSQITPLLSWILAMIVQFCIVLHGPIKQLYFNDYYYYHKLKIYTDQNIVHLNIEKYTSSR